MNIKEILKSHSLWLANISKGERANLHDADLYGANLHDADLYGANLRNANLCNANLRNADLRHTNLYGANLRNAKLLDANLHSANLRHVNLRDTNLYGADLRHAKLRDANLYGANLRNTNLRNADLYDADLHDADLRYCVGDGVRIRTFIGAKWHIVFTNDVLAIGCQQHPIDEWIQFSDEVISEMHPDALEWWKTWKPILIWLMGKSGVEVKI